MNEEILTTEVKNNILKLTIREFRNNFTKYRHFVENGGEIMVFNRDVPILVVSAYKKGGILESK